MTARFPGEWLAVTIERLDDTGEIDKVMSAQDVSTRLTIGLPVFNGERYLSAAIDSLLSQTYSDFELIISDNGSTDHTREICEDYVRRDGRITYHRHPRNIGGAGNHNYVAACAHGELFKWASDDDLYHPEYLARCIDLLDQRPEFVLAHCPTTFVDVDGLLVESPPYRLDSGNGDPVVRFRSLLYDAGGDDVYGVMRTPIIRTVAPHNSYHYAERPLMCEIVLHGPFGHVSETLYFRRDHPGRSERASSMRARCVKDDPHRADRIRHPAVRLYGEYVLGFLRAVFHAPLTPGQRARCLIILLGWLVSHGFRSHEAVQRSSPDPAIRDRANQVRIPRRHRGILRTELKFDSCLTERGACIASPQEHRHLGRVDLRAARHRQPRE